MLLNFSLSWVKSGLWEEKRMQSPTGFSPEDSGVPGTVAGLSDLVLGPLKELIGAALK